MNRPQVYKCRPSHLPSHPVPLGCPRAPALGALLQALNLQWPSTLHMVIYMFQCAAAATAAKSLQSCPTLCDPIDGSPPGSPAPGIFQARVLSGVPLPSLMFQCGSLKSSHPRLLPWSPKVCSLHLCLLCCPACRIIGTVFLNSVCIAFGILIPQPGIKPVPPALEARSLNH